MKRHQRCNKLSTSDVSGYKNSKQLLNTTENSDSVTISLSETEKPDELDGNEMELFITGQKELPIEEEALVEMEEKRELIVDDLRIKLHILEALEEIQESIQSILQRMENFMTAHKHKQFNGEFLERIFTNLKSFGKLAKICRNDFISKIDANNLSEVSVIALREFKQTYSILGKHFRMVYKEIRKEVSNMDQANYNSIDENIVS